MAIKRFIARLGKQRKKRPTNARAAINKTNNMQHGGKVDGNKRGRHYEAVLEGGTPQSVWQTVCGSERSNGIIKRWYEQTEESGRERERVEREKREKVR